MIPVLSLPYFADPDTQAPLSLAYVFVGEVDTDPEILENRVTVVLRQEDGTEVPIAPSLQPLRTGTGGLIEYNGAAVEAMVNQNYSLKVLSSDDVQKIYRPASLTLEAEVNALEARVEALEDEVEALEQLVEDSAFPSGTRMIFFQATAPEGWTKIADFDDYMIRIISGSGGGSGGTDSPISIDENLDHAHSTSGHTLTASEIPAVTGESLSLWGDALAMPDGWNAGSLPVTGPPTSRARTQSGPPPFQSVQVRNSGGGNSHSHGDTSEASLSVNWSPKYINCILCQKD